MLRLRQTLLAFVTVCVLLTAFGFPDAALGSAPVSSGPNQSVPSSPAPALTMLSPAEPKPVTLEELRASLPADVALSDPGADAVCFTCYYNLLETDPEGRFRPEELATRSDAAAALLQLSGQEAAGYDSRFPDVTDGDPRASAMVWCAENGVIPPDEDGTFQPDRPLTRGELASTLRQFAALQGWDTQTGGSLDGYWDSRSVPEELRDDLAWSVENKVFKGLAGNYLLPGSPLTRAQLAQTLACLSTLAEHAETSTLQAAKSCQARSAEGVSFEQREAIQAAVDQIAKEYHAVGIQVAVIENGIPSASFSGGWATRSGKSSYSDAQTILVTLREDGTGEIVTEYQGNGDIMTPDHKERIASVSKVVLGMAAVSLAEDGIVDLDESIGTYWNANIRNSRYPDDPICVDNLLSHTSSITLPESGSYTYSAVRSSLSGSLSSGRKPGSINSWSYSNFGFGVLGMTLELAADQMIDDMLDERFFEVLDIDAGFRPSDIEAQDKIVNIYDASGALSRSVDAQRNVGSRSTQPGGYGGIFSGGLTISAKDMAKLVAVLAGDGTYEGIRLLSEESVAYMEAPVGTTSDGFDQCHPLRHREEMYGRDELYYHTGSAWGVYNCISYDPATGDGVVVLTSGASSARDQYGVYAVCGEISSMIYDLLK